MIGASSLDKAEHTIVPKRWRMFTLSIILVIPVFLDLLNGFLVYKMNMTSPILAIYRGGIVFLAIPVLLMLKDKRHVVWLLAVMALFFIDMVAWTVFKTNSIGKELANILKVIYPYLALGIILLFIERKWLSIIDMINLQLTFCVIAAVSILLSFVLGVGIDYGGSRFSFGTKSFFSAQNDISLTLLIGFILNGGMMLSTLKKRYFLIGLVIFSSLIALSTRSGIMGAIGVAGVLVVLMVISSSREVAVARYKKNIVFFLSSIILVVGLVALVSVIKEYHYLITKFESLSEEQPREKLASGAIRHFKSRPTAMNIFGEGRTSFKNSMAGELVGLRKLDEDGKTVEVDYLDLTGNYGIPFAILLMAFPFWVWIKCASSVLLNWSVWSVIFFMAISLFLIHSILAGHALISPQVGTAMVLVYAYALVGQTGLKKFEPK